VTAIPPLFPVAPTLVDDATGMRAWCFDEKRIFVSQSTAKHFSPACADFLTLTAEVEIQRRWVQGKQRVRFVHDWRSVESYDAAVHPAVVQWGRASLAHTEHVAVALSPKASMFVRIAVTTGIGALRLLKMPIEVVEDLEPVLRALR
jgi:hypothetical protein